MSLNFFVYIKYFREKAHIETEELQSLSIDMVKACLTMFENYILECLR